MSCRVARWDALPGLERGVAVAFAVTGYHYAFQAGLERDGDIEASVAAAYGEPGGDGVLWVDVLDGFVEEGDGVVGDIVVQPGEDCAGFVGC